MILFETLPENTHVIFKVLEETKMEHRYCCDALFQKQLLYDHITDRY